MGATSSEPYWQNLNVTFQTRDKDPLNHWRELQSCSRWRCFPTAKPPCEKLNLAVRDNGKNCLSQPRTDYAIPEGQHWYSGTCEIYLFVYDLIQHVQTNVSKCVLVTNVYLSSSLHFITSVFLRLRNSLVSSVSCQSTRCGAPILFKAEKFPDNMHLKLKSCLEFIDVESTSLVYGMNIPLETLSGSLEGKRAVNVC